MVCPACGEPTIVCTVPEEFREYAPGEAATVTVCTTCLTIEQTATSEPPADGADFGRVSDAFPTDPDAAVPLALAIDLCSSLATNRAAIEALLEAVERAGTDPLLVIDRLERDPDLEPAVDLGRRRHQLEQLLY